MRRIKTFRQSRKAVKAALEKAGVGAQVPEAEGYGEEFATVAETASDAERQSGQKNFGSTAEIINRINVQ